MSRLIPKNYLGMSNVRIRELRLTRSLKTTLIPKLPANTTPRRFGPKHPGARGLHPRVRSRAPADETKLPPLATRKTPRQFCPNHPGAQGLHPRVRSRAPVIKIKIP